MKVDSCFLSKAVAMGRDSKVAEYLFQNDIYTTKITTCVEASLKRNALSYVILSHRYNTICNELLYFLMFFVCGIIAEIFR